MSKSEIKAAMEALKVSQPYKLNQSPTFKLPKAPPLQTQISESSKKDEEIHVLTNERTQEIRGTQDSEGSQVFERAQGSKVSQNSKGNQNAEPTQFFKVPSENEPSRNSNPTQETRAPLKTRASGMKATKREIILTDEKGESMRVNKKDLSALDLVPHLHLSTDGYGSLSNRILEILFRADFDKAEHEIIQFIIRESIFWRQEWTDPMSGSDFERLSGITSSSLWTHLKRLTDRGWVEKALVKAPGKGQACNQYRLNPLVWGPLLPKKRKDTPEIGGSQETKGTQDSEVVPPQDSKGTSYLGNQTTASLYEKKSIKTDLKISLSQGPEALENRWSKMVDHGNYEREIFFNLLETYGKPVWDHCTDVLDYLKTNGDLRKKPVGSPFGLLAQGENWDIFLGLTLAKKNKELALQAAKSAPPFVETVEAENHPIEAEAQATPPPAEFRSFFSKKRGPSPALRVFEGQFVDMETAFQRRFVTQNEQWAEIESQLGPVAGAIDNEKAKWITGIQRWFRGAWDRGEIAS